MTGDEDIDDLRGQLHRVAIKLTSQRAQRTGWENKLLAASQPGLATKRALANSQLYAVTERIVELERKHRAIEVKIARYEELEIMKHLDETFPVLPPHPNWKLRCWRALTINGTPYARHAEVDPNELAQCYNAAALLAGGHIRWMPDSIARPAPPPAPPPAAKVAVPDDPVGDFARAVQRAVEERGCCWADAEDHVARVDSSLFERAQAAFVLEPQVVVDNAFGGGGQGRVRSGIGSFRRVFSLEAFRARLRGVVSKQTGAAA